MGDNEGDETVFRGRYLFNRPFNHPAAFVCGWLASWGLWLQAPR